MAQIIVPEEVARRLQEIAEAEGRSPEDVLARAIERYQPDIPSSAPDRESEAEAVRRVRRRVYEMARQWWREHGEADKAALTDEEMDEQFYMIDAEGVPRMLTEKDEVEIRPGTLAYAGQVFKEMSDFYPEETDLSERGREIMNGEFTDHLLSRLEEAGKDDDEHGTR
jgi:hypothetical protein